MTLDIEGIWQLVSEVYATECSASGPLNATTASWRYEMIFTTRNGARKPDLTGPSLEGKPYVRYHRHTGCRQLVRKWKALRGSSRSCSGPYALWSQGQGCRCVQHLFVSDIQGMCYRNGPYILVPHAREGSRSQEPGDTGPGASIAFLTVLVGLNS